MQRVGFILITDKNYLYYSLFVASSIKIKKPNSKKVLILVNCLDQKVHLSFIARELELTLVFVEEVATFSKFSQEMIRLDVSKKRHVTNTSYLKLLLIQHFENQFDRIIYMDIDLLLMGNLDELCNMDLQGYPIGGIKDFRNRQLTRNRKNKKYFNAGLLVIDLSHTQIEYLGEALISQIQESKNFRYQDQDILNNVFDCAWFEIPNDYNYQIAFRYPSRNLNLESLKVIHFIGPLKPWKVRLGRYHEIWESKYMDFQLAHQSYIPMIHPKKTTVGLRILIAASTIPVSNILPISIRIILANFLTKKIWWR